MIKLKLIFKGGKGSGNFGHKGRAGEVGGSSSGGGSGMSLSDQIKEKTGMNIETNKSLKTYQKSGMTGKIKIIYDAYMSKKPEGVSERHVKGMAMIALNAALNGGVMPGMGTLYAHESSFAQFMSDDASWSKAFQIIKANTAEKYAIAADIIDSLR